MAPTKLARLHPVRSIWWPVALLAFALWSVLGFALFLSRHSALSENMFPGGPITDDLFTYYARLPLLGTPAFYVQTEQPPTFAYPPAAAYLLRGFLALPHAKIAFLLLCAATGVLFCFLFAWLLRPAIRGGQRWAMAVSFLLFSYPLVFAAERGNIEVFICLLLTAGIVAITNQRVLFGAVCLGLAATIKPFPVLLFGIFLARPVQWRALLLACATMVLTTAICLWAAGPTVLAAARGFFLGTTNIERNRAGTSYQGGIRFDHSFFSPFKILALNMHLQVRPLLDIYYVLIACLLLWGAWRVSGLPLLNRIAFYSIVAVAASPISYEYTLIDCYPLLMLVAASVFFIAKQRPVSRFEALVLGCSMLVFLPFTLYGNGTVSFGGQVDAALLLVLLFASLRRPWPSVFAPSWRLSAPESPFATGIHAPMIDTTVPELRP